MIAAFYGGELVWRERDRKMNELIDSTAVPSWVMTVPKILAIFLILLIVNLAAVWVLSQASGSMNARGALLHVLSDLLGSAAAIVAGAVIVGTGWTPIDPILSIAVSLLILRSTWRLMAQSIGVLMERVPAHLDYDEIGGAQRLANLGERHAAGTRRKRQGSGR